MPFITLDIDECLRNNGGCEYSCSNTDGSYKCGCQPGFKLKSNGHDCEGIIHFPFYNPISRKIFRGLAKIQISKVENFSTIFNGFSKLTSDKLSRRIQL